MVLRTLFVAALVCACSDATVYAPRVALPGTDGAEHSLTSSRATVLVFFSAHCPCMRAHDARLIALANDYAARGVAFYAVDSEVNATADTDAREAAARGYPFPILVDDKARVARALGADYATYSVVLDARGDVVYRGGLDSDHTHLSASPSPYLRDALDDVVAGHAVRRAKTEPLGCALRTW